MRHIERNSDGAFPTEWSRNMKFSTSFRPKSGRNCAQT